MTDLRGWQRVLFGVMVLLLALSLPACTCADEFERLINELIAQLIEEIEQAIREWWQNLVEDIKQQIANWWEDRKQDWNNFWSGVFPSAPTITSPTDNSRVDRLVVPAEGQGRAGSTLVVYRDGHEIGELAIGGDGFWHLTDLKLHTGENLITARVRSTLLPFVKSPASNAVRVISTTDTPRAKVPGIRPDLSPNLNRFEWMTALALAKVEQDLALYADHHEAYFCALRLGLLVSQTDEIAHHYLDPELDLSNNVVYLVFSARAENTPEEVQQALLEAAADTVADDAILAELQGYIRESLTVEGHEVVQVDEEAVGVTIYSVHFTREFAFYKLSPRAWSTLRINLRNALIANVLGGLFGDLAAALADLEIVWGRADADSEAERYFDLAVRAWNYDGSWNDYNGYDQDQDQSFATNQEWAMFYLGRALFYAQVVSDPYYTIPYYQPKRETFVETTRMIVGKTVEWGITYLLTKKLPLTIGGATALVVDVSDLLGQIEDTWNVYQEHRPAFAHFIEGDYYDYAVPEDLRKLGSQVERAGYPFRHENDLVVHSLLDSLPLEGRSADPEPIDLLQLVVDSIAPSVPDEGNPADMVREVGRRSHQYVHGGGFGRADRRIPEVHMLLDSPYTLREIYRLDNLSYPEKGLEPATGDVVRITLLDGSRVDGQVVNPPFPSPWQNAPYHNTSINMFRLDWADHYVDFTIIELEELRNPDNDDAPLPYETAAILKRQGSNTLYLALDIYTAFPETLHEIFYNPLDGRGFAGPVYRALLPPFVGLDGSKGQHDDYDERDGAAKMSFDHLMLGTDASVRLLRMFVHQAQTYDPPPTSVIGPDDLGVAWASPVQVHLYDHQGRHVGPNATGNYDLEIPSAQVFDNDTTPQHFIVVPNLGPAAGCRVEIVGIDSGTFDLDLYYTDALDRAVHHVTYETVPVQASTQGRLAVKRGRSPVLDVDTDGDGTYEEALSPTHERSLPIFQYRFGSMWLSLVPLAVAGALGVAILVLLMRRRRHRQLAPAPVVQAQPTCVRCGTMARPGARFCPRCGGRLASAAPALPVCARCGAVAQRPGARFCPRCGSPLPAAAAPRPQLQPATERQVRGRLLVAFGALAMLLCFFLPWVDCSGLQVSGWEIPGSFGTINFRGTLTGPPGYVVYLVPLSAAVALLLLRWARRKIAGGLHILIGGGGLLFVGWVFLGGGALACSRWGLWGTIVGLVGIVWGGIKEIRE